jgi:ubiquinone/menaquinone biosynthesis C-methylase UbiE
MNPRIKAYADFLDRVFDDCPFDWTRATLLAREVFQNVPLEGKDILDLGCGAAGDRAWFFLSEKKASSYLGVDLCRRALESSRLDDGRARVLWADLHRLPLPDASVDLIYCRGVATYAWNLKKAIEEAWRVLRPGGDFIVDFSKPTLALFFIR